MLSENKKIMEKSSKLFTLLSNVDLTQIQVNICLQTTYIKIDKTFKERKKR